MLLENQASRFLPENFECSLPPLFRKQREFWEPELKLLIQDISQDQDPYNRIEIDPLILPLVLSIRMLDLNTTMSCEGHQSDHNPASAKYPYVWIKNHQDFQYPHEVNFLQKTFDNLIASCKAKGLLMTSDMDTSMKILKIQDVHYDKVGHDVYFGMANTYHSWVQLHDDKGSDVKHNFRKKLFNDFVKINSFISKFDIEMGHTPNEIKIMANPIHDLGIIIMPIDTSGKFLKEQQKRFLKFADYLLAQKIVANGSILQV